MLAIVEVLEKGDEFTFLAKSHATYSIATRANILPYRRVLNQAVRYRPSPGITLIPPLTPPLAPQLNSSLSSDPPGRLSGNAFG